MRTMKKMASVLLLLAMLFGLAACGGGEEIPSVESGTSTSQVSSGGETEEEQNTDSGTEDVVAPEKTAPNMMLACDQYKHQIALYDMDMLEPGDDLEFALVWTMDDYSADIKYRENTVFGDVILTTSGIFSYPSGDPVWKCTNAGVNTHAIEILPDGDIVFANSDGGTVRYFNTSVLLDDPDAEVEWKDHALIGAHGVVYDPEYEILWALGTYKLIGFAIVSDTEIRELEGVGARLPDGKQGGHDLSADYTDTRYLYLTSNSVLRFDKETRTFKGAHFLLNRGSGTKGFGNNENNNFMFVVSTGGNPDKPWGDHPIAGWCSDMIYYATWSEDRSRLNVESYVSSERAFYKTRPFVGTYQ